MRRLRRDVVTAALAVGGLALAIVGLPAYADTTSPSASTPDQPSTSDPADRQRMDPGAAYDAALREAQTVAVAEAERLLQQTLTEVDAAEADVTSAQAEAQASRDAEDEAKKQLKIAARVVSRTESEIDEIKERTDETRDALGAVVRDAYQNNGLAAVGVLLGAESPDDLDDRYVGVQAVLDASDATLGRLAGDEADLRNALTRLEDQRERQEDLAEEASRRRADAEAAAERAEDAQARQERKQEQLEHALALAEEARLEDYERYMEQIDEATAIDEYLDGLSSEDYGTSQGSGTLIKPATGSTTSGYGSRFHPILGYVKIHTGVDFSSGDGKIYAADAGTVIEATYNTAYGNMVIIDHGVVDGQRLTTLYAHQAGLSVSVGQQVQKGQVIGTIGSTGYSTGPHLHFEVRLDGAHTDPLAWLP